MSEVEIKLHVGDTLRIEGPDGSVATYLVQQIKASSGYSPEWVTTTPLTGQVALTLLQTEPRTGTWAQNTSEPPRIIHTRPDAPVIEVRDPSA